MLELGTVVDRYRIEAVVASGGMATVYRVRHVQLGSEHALKVLDLPNASLKERLLTEGQVQARLNHPNLVRVTDIVPVNDAFGLVMEFVNGPTLEEWIAGLGPWPDDAQRRAERIAECERLFRGILSAVAYVLLPHNSPRFEDLKLRTSETSSNRWRRRWTRREMSCGSHAA